MRVAPNDKSLGRTDRALARRRVESVRLNTPSYALDWARVHHSQPNAPASNRYHWIQSAERLLEVLERS